MIEKVEMKYFNMTHKRIQWYKFNKCPNFLWLRLKSGLKGVHLKLKHSSEICHTYDLKVTNFANKYC